MEKYAKNKKRKYAFETSTEESFFFHNFERLQSVKFLETYCETLEEMKQRALYVDFDEKGTLSHPGMFGKNVCDSNLGYVKSLLIVAKNTMLEKNEQHHEKSTAFNPREPASKKVQT